MSRRRYTDEEKSRLLAKFEAGGTSAAAFCREEGLCYQSFLNWRRNASPAGPAPQPTQPTQLPRFIEVELGAAPRAEAAPAVLVELDLGHGILLRVRRETASRP